MHLLKQFLLKWVNGNFQLNKKDVGKFYWISILLPTRRYILNIPMEIPISYFHFVISTLLEGLALTAMLVLNAWSR